MVSFVITLCSKFHIICQLKLRVKLYINMLRFGLRELLLIMQFVKRFECLLGTRLLKYLLLAIWTAFCICDGRIVVGVK